MRLRPQQLRGFYAVLDRPSQDLGLALLTSAVIIQARKKPATAVEMFEIASMARRLSAGTDALLVVNDDLDLAHQVAADGVHLGQTDTPLRHARRRTDLFIGVSTHDIAQLEVALEQGADYVAFGPIFVTHTKANPDDVVGLDALARAVEIAGDTPLVAIGGITVDNIGPVRATGASAACVISWVNDSADPRARGSDIAAAWD